MQQRLPKFERVPSAFAHRQVTERSLEILATAYHLRFTPSSLMVRLVKGDQRTTEGHLQWQYHRGLINRFVFPKARGNPGEFIYYIDSPRAVELLRENASDPEQFDFNIQRNNREKNYAAVLSRDGVDDREGRLLFLRHELMISRFHATLELACRNSAGRVELAAWRQGAELNQRVKIPDHSERGQRALFGEATGTVFAPHRPDAFFTLHFPDEPEGRNNAHFFYEADRRTTTTKRFIRKLQAHFEFVVKQQLQERCYGIRRVRAVLIETTNADWAEQLRSAAQDKRVSGLRPSELFWFTSSDFFVRLTDHSARPEPIHLSRPDIIFDPIWLTPCDDRFRSLLE